MVDSSGIRLILTPQLRQHDAGGMTVGVSVQKLQFIPPFQKAFLSTGYCTPECTETVSFVLFDLLFLIKIPFFCGIQTFLKTRGESFIGGTMGVRGSEPHFFFRKCEKNI